MGKRFPIIAYREGKMVTIKDVAKIAGVSPATVSRIINNTKPVSDNVRKRVEEAIERTGFRPNTIARSLILKKSLTIGVLITDISNRYYSEMVRGIENKAYENGYAIMLCDSNYDFDMEMKYLNLMREKYVDGVIISTKAAASRFGDFLKSSDLAAVFTNRKDDDYYTVSVDNYGMTYKAVEYLIKSGHRNIGCIYAHLEDLASGLDRFEGYKKAMSDYDMVRNTKIEVAADFSIDSGYDSMKRILETGEKITAVFASSDEMAIGAMTAIQDFGLVVPDDISVIGFDDIHYSAYVRPGLTTVHQPIYDTGTRSVEVLLDIINNRETDKKTILESEIKHRNSVRVLN